jgi:hypothetical protein
VELTPEREYLLVTEFFDGATELGEAEIGDPVIDDGPPGASADGKPELLLPSPSRLAAAHKLSLQPCDLLPPCAAAGLTAANHSRRCCRIRRCTPSLPP